jgi:hypothetical protein
LKCKIKIAAWLEYLLIAFMLLDGTTMWKMTENSILKRFGITPYICKYIVFALIVIYVFIITGKIRIKTFNIIGVTLLFFGLYVILNRYNVLLFALCVIAPIVLFSFFIDALYYMGRIKAIFLEYGNLVCMLAGISLILYFLGPILGIVGGKSVYVIRSDVYRYYVNSYFGLMYTGQEQTVFGITFMRNTGIFLEAPGWAFPLCLALLIELCVREKVNKRNIAILCMTIVTTFSSKGFIFAGVIFFLYYMRDEMISGKIKKNAAKLISVPMLLIIGINAVFMLMESKSVNEAASYYGRIDDTIVAFDVWKKYYFVGCGYNNYEPYNKLLSYGRNTTSVTCGLLKMLGQCGTFFGLFYLYSYIRMILKTSKKEKYTMICSAIVLLGFLFVSSGWENLAFLFMVSYGLRKTG